MYEWIQIHETALWGLGLISVVTSFGSLIVIPILVVRIPEDYFARSKPPPSRWRKRHPAVRISVLVIKNVLGAICILTGIAMLFLPGQGIITIVVGITLMNFPGKRTMERSIIQQRPIRGAVNWLRARAHHPPLQAPQRGDAQEPE